MNYQDELLAEARKAVAECPEQRSKIIDLCRLAMDEIEEGGSPAHEYELFMDSLDELKKGDRE